MQVVPAESGVVFERSRVYVAVSGVHLLLLDDHILIDVLFRSAAASLGGRVTGLVLSGSLSDGTAGLRAIKRCGGTTVVQDPDDAVVPSMPRNALRYAEIDYVRPVAEMANLLARLAQEPAGPSPRSSPISASRRRSLHRSWQT